LLSDGTDVVVASGLELESLPEESAHADITSATTVNRINDGRHTRLDIRTPLSYPAHATEALSASPNNGSPAA
jgi:hypothetical protein